MILSEYFRGKLIGKRIANFPYPEKFCTYCNKKCDLVDAIHVTAQPENYKALYICQNPRCDAFDDVAREAYAKVYYSSNESYAQLEMQRIYFDKKKIR